MTKKGLFLSFLSLFLLVGCDDWNTTTPSTGTNGTVDQSEEIDRLEEFNELRENFAQLSARWNSALSEGSIVGFTTTVEEVDELESDIATDLNALSNTTSAGWEDAREEVENSLNSFEDWISRYEEQVQDVQDETTGNEIF